MTPPADEHFHDRPTLVDPLLQKIPTPTHIGSYKIEGELHRTQMSTLFLGIHPQTKELITLKVLSPQYVTRPEMVEQFFKEAKILTLLSHPNIVKLYDEGRWEGGVYLVMEFIQGISLKQFITQHSFSLKRSIEILLQIAHAVAHLHTHNIVHGDLKPENILLTEKGEIKVIDFGLAHLHGEAEAPSGGIGTPIYMSPERKRDPSQITFSSDLYSLGIIAYELIQGQLSYGIIHTPRLPQEIGKIISKACSLSVENRYPDIASFVVDLSQYSESKLFEKERLTGDRMKEILELMEKSRYALSPSPPFSFPDLDVRMAKREISGEVGYYFDVFQPTDNTYLFLMSELLYRGMDALVYLAIFRGMIRTLLQERKRDPFSLPSLVSSLHQLIGEDRTGKQLAFSALLLDERENGLTLLSCGLGGIVHIPENGHPPRHLTYQNPPLGTQGRAEFSPIIDTWQVGDLLLFHSFPTSPTLSLAVSATHLLAHRRKAEEILQKIPPQESLQMLFSIERLGI